MITENELNDVIVSAGGLIETGNKIRWHADNATNCLRFFNFACHEKGRFTGVRLSGVNEKNFNVFLDTYMGEYCSKETIDALTKFLQLLCEDHATAAALLRVDLENKSKHLNDSE